MCHPGVDNEFLRRTESEVALRYHGDAPLERHHAYAAYALMRRPATRFFSRWDAPRAAALELKVRALVLATDMKHHRAFVERLAEFQEATKPPPTPPPTPPTEVPSDMEESADEEDEDEPEPEPEPEGKKKQSAMAAALGIPDPDAEEEPELLADFLAITGRMNDMWNSGENTDEMLPVIAQDAGMDEEATAATLAGFEFPSIEDQLSETWLGGGTQEFLLEVANFFVETGNIDAARDSYESAVNTGPLMAANGDM